MPSCDNDIVDYSGKKLSEEDIKECVQQLRELLDGKLPTSFNLENYTTQ